MKKRDPTFVAHIVQDPLSRPALLAEKLAKVLNGEDVSDVAIAMAMVMSGLVQYHAEDQSMAEDLMESIRGLEDRLLEAAYNGGSVKLQ